MSAEAGAPSRTWLVDRGGERLDLFLSEHEPDLSRAFLQRLIRSGQVTLNGATAKPSTRLKPGDEIALHIPPPAALELLPETIPLNIVFEDSDVLVIDKPAGLVVHPAPGHAGGTLVNAVLAHCPDLGGIGGTLRPGIVHRLDKDTSGLMVVAKNERAQESLAGQFKRREVMKAYLALVHGRLEPSQGTIRGAIGRDRLRPQQMAVVGTGGKEAITHYRVLERFAGSPGHFTLVEAQPETGRSHQIRVHFATLGHPVAGDRVYGPRAKGLAVARQFLHAHVLGFRLPSTGEWREFRSPLPHDLEQVLRRLESSPLSPT
ncbi:MAG: RluA family pseudouridine synthase [Chloroflexi bacterium]|nr:RluA family pseudouridine synthase [Chloroflexota bacterium]